ncbi:uncharacterized protein OCT59_023739 [Rhizophagus irregularis]|uniref:uncharacterized protein n=1 Tax=Rhizophagus irregularis TaxID=588596 RepID=UPI003321268E|nr:hypothetical protein OCT59_023739 [Rhizophagus irregularis]
MDETPKDLWEDTDENKYQLHATIPTIDSTIESENVDERVVYIGDLEKRKQAYGICGECKEPGTGWRWCQSCNAKRFKDNFKNWTSGNKDIDEFIQQSQLNAVYHKKYLEWIPFEKFQNITYIAEGGFDFLNEIKSHLQIYIYDIVQCFGITQDPNNKEYMMVIEYCNDGNLRNYLNKSENYINYKSKIDKLQQIARGLLDIHNSEKVHKDFHSGNLLINHSDPYISDLGMCQPANIKQTVKEEGIYGVLPYMAPEVLRGQQYTKAADIYSFGIIMNEFLSEEIPFNDIPHNEFLAIKICKGLRPTISKDIPKLLADLIIKCWDAEIKNRPTTKELYQLLNKWYVETKDIEDRDDSEDGEDGEDIEDNEDSEDNEDEDSKNGSNSQKSELYFQIKECDKIRKEKFKNRSNEDKSKSFKTHPQAIYTSRLLNFKNLPNPVNSSDLLSFQFSSDTSYTAQSTSANLISECLDVQLSELELNEICQDGEDNFE